ncbi:hypothetical protein DV495_003374 [Geotrichum candidum]|uniref:Similar to Saccharomyces cerevisiae YOL111C MDY2 Protein with a role in insertion of tail-anchored proteins into the ER membrane n=1 Tax=Geotrichum candidum TaxID=1173061 RepID=A0A0J9X8Y1_GEOCN|nr:hypothetical protein DV452_000093 [Geotrichum candidum]KAI9211312.1 hypothetical protein DS838_003816 [Geotrichum bryndzae]KAF5126610.1 hypothetical protein DV495_003374 [Geotrichum candidum]KAF7499311.1 hypothetical protein DV113_002665 [Geotrichum candidum]KAI8134005.1 hypothetical protein DUD61_002366 [Geotrichum candidum]
MTSAISEQQFASGFLHLLHTNTPVFSATHTTSQSRGPVTLTKMPAPKRKRTDAGLGSSADAAAAAGPKRTFAKLTLKSIKAPKFTHTYAPLAVDAQYTVLDLKQRAIDENLVPAGSELRFLLKGKVLKDSGLVADLGDEGAELMITVLVTAGAATTSPVSTPAEEEKKEAISLTVDEPVWAQIGQVLDNAYGSEKAAKVLEKLKASYQA